MGVQRMRKKTVIHKGKPVKVGVDSDTSEEEQQDTSSGEEHAADPNNDVLGDTKNVGADVSRERESGEDNKNSNASDSEDGSASEESSSNEERNDSSKNTSDEAASDSEAEALIANDPLEKEKFIAAIKSRNLSTISTGYLEKFPQCFTEPLTDKNETALHLAVSSGVNIEVIKYVLAQGADPNAVTKAGDTCLHILVSLRDTAQKLDLIAIKLIDAGADLCHVNAAGLRPDQVQTAVPNQVSRYISQKKQAIVTAIEAGKWGWLEEYVVKNPSWWNLPLNVKGETALHVAIRSGRPGIVEKILHSLKNISLMQQTQIINHPDQQGNTPLHYTVIYTSAKSLEHLLKYDPDIHAINKDRKKAHELKVGLFGLGKNVVQEQLKNLVKAIEGGKSEQVKQKAIGLELLSLSELRKQLVRAVQNDDLQSFLDIFDAIDETMLIFPAEKLSKRRDVIKERNIIDEDPIELDLLELYWFTLTDDSEKTLLHHAIEKRSVQCVEYFLQAGHPIVWPKWDEPTEADLQREKHDNFFKKIVIENLSEKSRQTLQWRENQKLEKKQREQQFQQQYPTILHFIAALPQYKVGDPASDKIFELLFNYGVDFSIIDNQGQALQIPSKLTTNFVAAKIQEKLNAFQQAVAARDIKKIKAFIDQSESWWHVPITAAPFSGRLLSDFQAVIKCDDVQLLKFFMSHCLLQSLKTDTPKTLLDIINEIDDTGFTLLHRAIVSGSVNCVKYLLEHGADVEKKGWLEFEFTPLFLAATHTLNNGQQITKLLLDHGADITKQINHPKNSQGPYYVHQIDAPQPAVNNWMRILKEMLTTAIQAGDVYTVKNYVQQNMTWLHLPLNDKGQTALHLMAQENHVELLNCVYELVQTWNKHHEKPFELLQLYAADQTTLRFGLLQYLSVHNNKAMWEKWYELFNLTAQKNSSSTSHKYSYADEIFQPIEHGTFSERLDGYAEILKRFSRGPEYLKKDKDFLETFLENIVESRSSDLKKTKKSISKLLKADPYVIEIFLDDTYKEKLRAADSKILKVMISYLPLPLLLRHNEVFSDLLSEKQSQSIPTFYDTSAATSAFNFPDGLAKAYILHFGLLDQNVDIEQAIQQYEAVIANPKAKPVTCCQALWQLANIYHAEIDASVTTTDNDALKRNAACLEERNEALTQLISIATTHLKTYPRDKEMQGLYDDATGMQELFKLSQEMQKKGWLSNKSVEPPSEKVHADEPCFKMLDDYYKRKRSIHETAQPSSTSSTSTTTNTATWCTTSSTLEVAKQCQERLRLARLYKQEIDLTVILNDVSLEQSRLARNMACREYCREALTQLTAVAATVKLEKKPNPVIQNAVKQANTMLEALSQEFTAADESDKNAEAKDHATFIFTKVNEHYKKKQPKKSELEQASKKMAAAQLKFYKQHGTFNPPDDTSASQSSSSASTSNRN